MTHVMKALMQHLRLEARFFHCGAAMASDPVVLELKESIKRLESRVRRFQDFRPSCHHISLDVRHSRCPRTAMPRFRKKS